MPGTSALPPTDAAVRESLLWGGRFFFLDSGVNWLVWGMLCVLMTKFVSTRRSGQETTPWQLRSVVTVFFLNTLNVVCNLFRMIQSNCKHFDDRAYKDAYRSRIVVPVSWFIGLAVIVGVQVLVLHRLYIFSRRLTPRLSSKKKLAFFALFSLDIATAIVGALSYAFALRFPKYSDIVREVQRPKTPLFLVLQLLWSCASVVIVLLQALFLHLEVRHARNISRDSGLPNRELAEEVLQHMHRGFIVNWCIVAGAHLVYLGSMSSQPAAMAGRACASISGLYVFGLLSQLIQPRETRNRQRLEARRAMSIYDNPRDVRARKQLFGGASGKKKTARGAVRGIDVGGVSKTVHLTSYAQRDSDFESVSDGQRRPDDIESVGSSSSDGPVEGEHDFALRSARKVNLGHSVWVEVAGRGGPRQLSANLHWSPPVKPLSRQASPTFEDGVASQNSQRRPLRASERPDRRADDLTLSFGPLSALPRSAHRPILAAPERSDRHGRLSFIDSFPTGPTMTRSHGVFNPDEISLSFAEVDELSPPAL